MELKKPDQDLLRELIGIASDLKWSAVELIRIAERLTQNGNEPDAQALIRMIKIFQSDEHRLTGYADQVKAGSITRVPSTSLVSVSPGNAQSPFDIN